MTKLAWGLLRSPRSLAKTELALGLPPVRFAPGRNNKGQVSKPVLHEHAMLLSNLEHVGDRG